MDWLFLLVPLIIIVVLAWTIVRRGYQMRDLVARGVPVSGRVVRRLGFTGSAGQKQRYLRYEFTVNGVRYSHKIAVTADEQVAYREGDAIELVYLPDNPQVSARLELVEQCRQALNKKGA